MMNRQIHMMHIRARSIAYTNCKPAHAFAARSYKFIPV